MAASSMSDDQVNDLAELAERLATLARSWSGTEPPEAISELEYDPALRADGLRADELVDLKRRINRALEGLHVLSKEAAHGANPMEHMRLSGKREGLLLVLDYLRFYER